MLPVAVVAAWVLMALAGCNQTKKEDNPIFWQLNFEPDSKAPYGCALAYQSLKTYFGVASVQKLPQNFIVSTLNNKTPPNGNVVVLVGQRAYFDREEWEEIHTFVEKGNDLLIATSNSYYYYGDNPMYGGDVSTHGEYSGNPTTLYETDLPMADSDTHPLTWNGDSVRYGYRGKNLVSEVRLLHPVCNPYHHDTTMIGDEYFKQTHYPVVSWW